ncbi:hypothetical protein E2562_017353 [Oryza meyeriana var. granulata]|uniref:QLQ domain-containing protein n=1 Tax=Oryza meyeriana var. granulata TaxID=110450 RepID=A0A6G1D521_9ORYZ|nr:hypothetical protein E2562_017353 [Oryza meyeriana var. granulata]
MVKLSSVIGPRYALMAGARRDAIFLRAELESMHAFLEKLSGVNGPDSQVRCWTKEVRELAYDVEDSIDEFMHRVHGAVASNNGLGSLRGLVSHATRLVAMAWTHHRLAGELKGLKARAIEVSERRSRYKLGEDIGMVLSIAGFGGLGKTTLAMEVYRRVAGRYSCKAFAAVSQKLDMRKLLKDLLSQVAQNEVNHMDTWEEGQLIRKLRECLLNKSLYPEDFKIERDSLIQQWIAEGFISEERGQSVEDAAESYFNELINRRSLPQEYHGRCDEQGGGQDGFLVREARASPSSSFLGSTSSSSGGGQMLSFSPNATAGLGLISGGSMQGVLARVRGPFTPTQWMELEHQALIYKHIAANVSVPSSLLLPIRRSLHPWGTFCSSSCD